MIAVLPVVLGFTVNASVDLQRTEGGWRLVSPPSRKENKSPVAAEEQSEETCSDAQADAVFSPATCNYIVHPGSGVGNFKEDTPPNKAIPQRHTICVRDEPVVLVVSPERLPPSRLRLSIDSTRGEHISAEWDPLASDRLAHKLVLPAGLWWVSFRSDSIRHASKTSQDLSWQDTAETGFKETSQFCLRRELFKTEAANAEGKTRRLHVYRLVADNVSSQTERDEGVSSGKDIQVMMSVERLPSVTRSLDVLTTREGGGFGGQSVSAAGRSAVLDLTSPGEIASQLAAVVAEVVVDRAKTQSLKSAQAAITDELGCNEEDPPWKSRAQWLRLSRSCSVVGTTSLDSLTSGIDTLRRAVEADLLESLGRYLATSREEIPARFRRTYDIAASELPAQVAYAIERGSVEPQAGQAMMALLAHGVRDAWIPDPATAPETYPLRRSVVADDELAAAAVGLVFAAASQCFAQSRCDARQLADMLSHPDRSFYFDEAPGMLEALIAYVKSWPDALRTAQLIVSVMRNGPATKPPDALAGAIDVAMEVQLVRSCLTPKAKTFPKPSDFEECLRGPEVEPIRTWRRALIAAVKGDGVGTISAIMKAIEKGETPPEVKESRLWRAAAAGVGAWGGEVGADTESKRAATKAAINAAIDVLTDHHERVGLVVSFSAALRVVAGRQTDSEGVLKPGFGGPSLPIGLSVEVPRLPIAKWMGVHLDISVFDLGRLLQAGAMGVTTDNKTYVDPAHLVWPQVSPGLLFAGGWLFVGMVVGFQPTTGEWSIGGSLGLQVPLIDFN